MKLCVDCLNSKGIWCKAPANGISPVDGEPITRWCVIERQNMAGCGIDANYFVPKSQPKLPWWKRIFK